MAEVVEIRQPNGQVVYALGGRVLWDDDRGQMVIRGGFLPGRFRLPALGAPLIFEADSGSRFEVGGQQFEIRRTVRRGRPDPWVPRSFGPRQGGG